MTDNDAAMGQPLTPEDLRHGMGLDMLTFDVSEGHGEYRLALSASQMTDLWPPRDELDGDEDEMMLLGQYRATVGAEPPGDDVDLAWENVVRVHAPRIEIEQALALLLVEVLAGPEGADDDTFDYWPSGVRLALGVAAHLGTFHHIDAKWTTLVERAARAAIADTRAEFADELLVKCGLGNGSVVMVCEHGRTLDQGCQECLVPEKWHIESR